MTEFNLPHGLKVELCELPNVARNYTGCMLACRPCVCFTEAVAGVCRCVLMCLLLHQHRQLYQFCAAGDYLAKHGYLLVWLHKLLSWCGVSLAHANVEQ